MNINEIKELLLVIDKTNLEFVKLESNDLKLEVSKNINSIDTKASTLDEPLHTYISDYQTSENNTNTTESITDEEAYIVTSPLMGTLYQAPTPDSNNFVKVGDIVDEGDTLCIVEAMKLMNEITSDIKGEITDILARNEDLVEYNQPLFKIKPI